MCLVSFLFHAVSAVGNGVSYTYKAVVNLKLTQLPDVVSELETETVATDRLNDNLVPDLDLGSTLTELDSVSKEL